MDSAKTFFIIRTIFLWKLLAAHTSPAVTSDDLNSTTLFDLPSPKNVVPSELSSIFLSLTAPSWIIKATSKIHTNNGTTRLNWYAMNNEALLLPFLTNQSQILTIDSIAEISIKEQAVNAASLIPETTTSKSTSTTELQLATTKSSENDTDIIVIGESVSSTIRPEKHMQDYPHCKIRSPYNMNDSQTWFLEAEGTSDPDGIPLFQLDAHKYEEVANFTVRKHNCMRSLVEPPAANMLKMEWNEEAAEQAQEWADQCDYQHNNETNRTTSNFICGQNIAYTTPWPFSWNSVINMWFGERQNYTYGQENDLHIVGHYTAMVWATTFQLGCAYKDCGGWHFYVCHYCPNGNFGDLNSPYKSGKNCEHCPDACEGGLCTNKCLHTNLYSNCDEMESKYKICSSKFQDHLAGHCKATCLCRGGIYG